MPSSPPNRNVLVERCSSLRGCEPCKRRKRVCNGQRPCGNCQETNQECVYSVVSDYSRSVFTTNSARRLSSGSACETCRRRKTKCDGGNPCAYCVNAGFECNNNSERRKRAQAHAQAQQQAAAAAAAGVVSSSISSPSSQGSSTPTTGGNNNNNEDHQAMDRIEDRLRRIEKLMTAFTPSSPLSRSSFTASSNYEQQTAGTVASRKLSSPHPPPPSSSSTPPPSVRQHRHSVQGISVAKEQAALRSILKGTPSATVTMTTITPSSSSPPSSPPLSPNNKTSITSSMLNLSLSPSSSTSSNQSSNEGCLSPSGEWKQSTPIPSLMDQLSRRTFVPTAMDYMQYPIYPISSTPSPKPMNPVQQKQQKEL
ncbi:hypothetical protein BDA99DRAFT_538141 [Phascolomyces articulosus]|uniref:Zn(2)-C6 fungal-type domain-containing protein n=1 Tax=Phascolomyces articulosus TaxID=60185 RepID=A0AAD5K7V1_9FUNG|nr:hypothetical protein BDA99DRAFT_538141 [Phascolomyces articulosus]